MKKYLFLAFIAVFSMFGADTNSKLAAELGQTNPNSTVNVIVQWRTTSIEAHHRKVSDRGGRLHRRLKSIRSASYSLPAYELNNLANDPDVAYITPDRPVRASLDYTTAAINAGAAWSAQLDGRGVGVAVIDSGINSNPDFGANQIVYSEDFTGEVPSDGNTANPLNAPDLYGHGEHVAGIIGNDGATSQCSNCTRLLKGVAPGVNLINLRVLDSTGAGTDSTVIAAIERAIALKDQFNIRVINLSVGRPVFEGYKMDPLCHAVEQAWQAGIVVVVAAGNDGRDNSMGTNGYGTITSPGNDPYVITVGAMKAMGTYDRGDDQIARYSSKGADLVDPS